MVQPFCLLDSLQIHHSLLFKNQFTLEPQFSFFLNCLWSVRNHLSCDESNTQVQMDKLEQRDFIGE